MTSTPTRASTARPRAHRRGAGWRAIGRCAAAFALAVAASGALLTTDPPPADAQVPPVTGAACAPGQGVTVVVDFNGLPGGIRIGCARGSQADGLAALGAAGFGVGTGDAPGVVCTIDGAPAEGYPFCWLTGGYWSYWRAPRGGSWAFSPVGAGGGPLPVDSVEGWSWAPDFASQAPRADETSAPPATTSTSSTPPTSSITSAPASTTSTSTPSGTSSVPRPTTTSAPATTSTTGIGAPTSPSTGPGAGAVAGAGSSAGRPTPGAARGTLARTGSSTRTPVTLAVILLLAGGVLVTASRRLATPHR